MFLRGLFEDPSLRIKLGFGLFDDNGAEGGGGGGEGEQNITGEGGEGDPSTQAGGEGGDSSQGQQSGRRDPGAQGKSRSDWVPYNRFQEVNRGLQAYRGFGTPAQLRARLERLEYLEKNPNNRYTPQQEEEIKADLLRLFPQLRSLEQNDEIQRNHYVSYGSRQNPEFCKQLGWEPTEANQNMIEDLLGGFINRNPELRQRFFARDPTLFAEVFKSVKPILAPAMKRVVPGLGLVGRKTVAPAGGTGKKGDDGKGSQSKAVPGSPLFERDVLGEASDAAFDLITSREE